MPVGRELCTLTIAATPSRNFLIGFHSIDMDIEKLCWCVPGEYPGFVLSHIEEKSEP